MQRHWRTLFMAIAITFGLVFGSASAQEKATLAPPQAAQPAGDSPVVIQTVNYTPLSAWYVQADAVILRRTTASHSPLLTDPTGATVIGNAEAFRMGFTGGPQITAGIQINEGNDAELRYFGVYNWGSNATFAGPGKLIGFGTSGSNFKGEYRSSVNSVEGVLRKWLNSDFAILSNIRYINWHESLNFNYNEPPVGVAAVVAGPIANSRVLTNNNMFGSQLGAQWHRELNNRLSIDIYGKTGAFANELFVRATNIDSTGTKIISHSVGRLAFEHEFGVIGTWRMTDRISLRGGATFMWVQHAALAPEQFGGLNFAAGTLSINAHPTVFVYGATAGFEVKW